MARLVMGYSQELLEANKRLMELRRQYQLKKKRALHAQYLLSPKWRSIKGQTLRRDGYICQDCKQNLAQDVHHLTYVRWGNELIEDLISLCRFCHKKRHNVENGPKI